MSNNKYYLLGNSNENRKYLTYEQLSTLADCDGIFEVFVLHRSSNEMNWYKLWTKKTTENVTWIIPFQISTPGLDVSRYFVWIVEL